MEGVKTKAGIFSGSEQKPDLNRSGILVRVRFELGTSNEDG